MSINVAPNVNNPVTLTPGVKALLLNAPTHAVTGTSNNAVAVGTSFGSFSLATYSAQVNEDRIIQATKPAMTLTEYISSIDYTPVQGNVTVDASNDSLVLSGIDVESVESAAVSWQSIPDLPAGTSHQILTYLNDLNGYVTTTRAMKGGQTLSATTTAGYSHSTGLLSYGSSQITDVYMEADYSEGGSTVSTVSELEAAISAAVGGETIILADGTYNLVNSSRWIDVPNLTIRSASDNPYACILQGSGFSSSESVDFIFQQAADNFTVRGITMRYVGAHLIQILGELNLTGSTFINCRFLDAYEQLLKVSNDDGTQNISDNGLVENCYFGFTADEAPYFYTCGIDAHQCENWTVRTSTFENFTSPGTGAGGAQACEHAIHFWERRPGVTDQNLLIERNLVLNSDRGIGFGLSPNQGIIGGVIKNNMVARTSAKAGPYADLGIEASECSAVDVLNNTVFLEDGYFTSIRDRYANIGTQNRFINNLTNTGITNDNGGNGQELTNNASAASSWFQSAATGDLRIDVNNSTAVAAVWNTGTTLASVIEDYNGGARPYQDTGEWDIGADELPIGLGLETPLDVAGLWTWADVNEVGANPVTVSGNVALVLDSLVNLADPGVNDYVTASIGFDSSDFRPGYNGQGVSIGSWSTDRIPLALSAYQPSLGAEPYGQWMQQAGNLNATGEFYLIVAHGTQRDAGNRWMWGADNSNYVKLDSASYRYNMKIAGSAETVICPSSTLSRYNAYITEIWRDTANKIYVRVNGGTVIQQATLAGTFAMSGFGGLYASKDAGWDEDLYTMLAYDRLPIANERTFIREYINNLWDGIY